MMTVILPWLSLVGELMAFKMIQWYYLPTLKKRLMSWSMADIVTERHWTLWTWNETWSTKAAPWRCQDGYHIWISPVDVWSAIDIMRRRSWHFSTCHLFCLYSVSLLKRSGWLVSTPPSKDIRGAAWQLFRFSWALRDSKTLEQWHNISIRAGPD